MGGEPTAKRKAQKGKVMSATVTTTNEMTMRKYHEAVLAIPGVPAEVSAKARAEIAKLDATNVKRAEKAAEKAKEYEPIKQAIYSYLVENGTKITTDIAANVELVEGSVPKTSAMCRQMVEEGRLTDSEVKVPKKGTQKAYTAVLPTE